MKHLSFHVTFSPPGPGEQNWPDGFWSVYAISGDDIAKRIKFDDAGKVIRRDSWSGHLGGGGSFEAVAKLIAAHKG
jgi:hypothetical protein